MKNDYEKRICTEKVLKFFSEQINYGHELDIQIDRVFKLKRGKVFTYIPTDTTDDNINDSLSGGGLLSREKSIYCLASEISEYLSIVENSICILEDSTCTPEDSFSVEIIDYIYTYDNEIYGLISEKNSKIDQVIKSIKEIEQPNYFLAVLVKSSEICKEILSRNKLYKDDFISIAEAAEKVILGAYDGEGYLIWERESIPSAHQDSESAHNGLTSPCE